MGRRAEVSLPKYQQDRHTSFYSYLRISASLAHFNDPLYSPHLHPCLRRLRNN